MYLQFPHQQYVYQLPADDETAVGTVTLAESCQLEHIVFDYYYHGIEAAAFTLQVHLYAGAAETPFASSDVVTMSPATLSGTAGLNRIGLFFTDFSPRPNLREGVEYLVKVETVGNTSTDASYFSLILDWYNEVNDAAVAGQAGARMHILGRETI